VVNALDQNLQYFEDRAWKAFVYVKALAIAEGKRLTDYLGKAVEDLTQAWDNLVRRASAEVLSRIRASSDCVLTSVAEVKALLLGLLERMKGRFNELQREIEGVSHWLFSAAQTTQEAENIYSRVAVALGKPTDPRAGQMRLASLMGGADVLSSVVMALKSEASPGYALAFADDTAYRFSKGMGTHMAWQQRSSFGTNNHHIV
jgi:uncharacterized protein YigA (DUF484 family)